MTIPGKGGRPRKWRSDADRVRAFRARQRGEPEPPVLSVALDDGDGLAAAWEQVRRLGQLLDEQRMVERSLRREAATAGRDLDVQQRRFGWLQADNDELRTKLAELERERNEQDDRVTTLIEENAALQRRVELLLTTATSPTSEPTHARTENRAQRRRAAKQARRRR